MSYPTQLILYRAEYRTLEIELKKAYTEKINPNRIITTQHIPKEIKYFAFSDPPLILILYCFWGV